MFLNRILRNQKSRWTATASAYQEHLRDRLRRHGGNTELAYADSIGSQTMELFLKQGDDQVAALKEYGLRDGMIIYDLGCGCGRTAQALQRSAWTGRYIGTDIVQEFVGELKRKCAGFEAYVHMTPTIRAPDRSVDMIFHWSVFTHVTVEDAFLYLEDSYRAMKPGAKLVFSFLELTNPLHYSAFDQRVELVRDSKPLAVLDTFLHRDWLSLWAERIGFDHVQFVDGHDGSRHPPIWQTVCTMTRPA